MFYVSYNMVMKSGLFKFTDETKLGEKVGSRLVLVVIRFRKVLILA